MQDSLLSFHTDPGLQLALRPEQQQHHLYASQQPPPHPQVTQQQLEQLEMLLAPRGGPHSPSGSLEPSSMGVARRDFSGDAYGAATAPHTVPALASAAARCHGDGGENGAPTRDAGSQGSTAANDKGRVEWPAAEALHASDVPAEPTPFRRAARFGQLVALCLLIAFSVYILAVNRTTSQFSGAVLLVLLLVGVLRLCERLPVERLQLSCAADREISARLGPHMRLAEKEDMGPGLGACEGTAAERERAGE